MIFWWIPPAIAALMVLVVTFWIVVTREAYSDLIAAVFLILCLPALFALWCFFYLLSFIP